MIPVSDPGISCVSPISMKPCQANLLTCKLSRISNPSQFLTRLT